KRPESEQGRVTQNSWPNELVSAEAGEEEVTDEPRDHTHTGVDNVHIPFGRTRRHAPLLQPLSGDESPQEIRAGHVSITTPRHE
ncbi:hypothetical protein, partial [Microbacterium sp. Bi128]|uniref:hypothetical protein n=1 Tax=Microbacterium sp. Bi128 TaxID=2821115 RepID=UPI001E5EAE65